MNKKTEELLGRTFMFGVSSTLKLLNESVYWLRIIKELYKENNKIENQIIEAIELRKFLIAIKKSAQQKL